MIHSEVLPAEPPKQALVTMVESRYGFSLVDFGLSDEDISIFDQLNIGREVTYNWFSSYEDFEKGISSCLQAVGENDFEKVTSVATSIKEIARQVLLAANKEVAWFCLRSSLPPDKVILKRWHMDGQHYHTNEIQYKFCMTLQGDPTFVYLLSNEFKQLRSVIWRNMNDVQFTNEFCEERKIFHQGRKEGLFIIIGNPNFAAFHSEPRVVVPRLFFSIVACDKDQIIEIKNRLELYYPPSEKEIYLIFK